MVAQCWTIDDGFTSSSWPGLVGEPVDGLVTVRRQLARPAVERRFLDQRIWTPPVEAERRESLLEAMCVSR